MPDTVYNFNNALKSWKMNAYKISSISGDDLILNASNNNNIYLNVSGGLVNVSKDLDVSNNLRVFGSLMLANNLLTDNSSVKIPSTYNNYYFTDPSNLRSKLTLTNDWVDLSDVGYKINYTPLSNKSKIYMRFKINYISSNESEQLITFRLMRDISGGSSDILYTDSSLGMVMGVINNGIYNADFVDTPNTNQYITYYLKYKIEAPANDIDISCGVVGYDSGNINLMMAQELYIPPSDNELMSSYSVPGFGGSLNSNNASNIESQLNLLESTFEASFNYIEQAIQNISGVDLESLSNILNDISNSRAEIDASFSSIIQSINDISGLSDVANIESHLSLLDTSFSLLLSSITSLNNKFDLSFSSILQTLNDISGINDISGFEGLNNLESRIDISFTSILADISLVQNNINNLLVLHIDPSFEILFDGLVDLSNNINELDVSFTDMIIKIANIESYIASLDNSFNHLFNSVKNLEDHIDNSFNSILQIGQQINNLDISSITNIDNNIGFLSNIDIAIKSDVAYNNSLINTNFATLYSLQNKLNNLVNILNQQLNLNVNPDHL